MVKVDAPEWLRRELSSPQWKPQGVFMSGVTDCSEPMERWLKLTRRCLEVLLEFRKRLRTHFPEKKEKVLKLKQNTREDAGGKAETFNAQHSTLQGYGQERLNSEQAERLVNREADDRQQHEIRERNRGAKAGKEDGRLMIEHGGKGQRSVAHVQGNHKEHREFKLSDLCVLCGFKIRASCRPLSVECFPSGIRVIREIRGSFPCFSRR